MMQKNKEKKSSINLESHFCQSKLDIISNSMIAFCKSSRSILSWSHIFPNSMLPWFLLLLLVLSRIGFSQAGTIGKDVRNKRYIFYDVGCRGICDLQMLARLDRVCEDCFNLFREPMIYSLCRKPCFTGDFFKGCVDALMLDDELEKFKTYIMYLHGAPPSFS